MLRGNKDIAFALLSGAIIKAIKKSFEGEYVVDWTSKANEDFLKGLIQVSQMVANLLLANFKDSAMVASRGSGVEGKLANLDCRDKVVSLFTVWFRDTYGREYRPKRIKDLKKLISFELRTLNCEWKPKKRSLENES
jgi:hypothetical protein